ncbi:cardiolipin synthase [Enterococcus rivorum]|uniref:Cardiolipin synthase n=1 Tax=Enterococcus rivorum TaxID=762845 RepID=A0A1E5KVU7_9ENTE|nr:cardiolipin synthase [Enterococcus rivorum]MBP2100336.1 cardiolipin synthase [Enterococcus rivorum]OEH81960.1 cardiolipin synthase [Enterococcus rivorum]
MTIFILVLLFLLVLNTTVALITVFRKQRSIASIFAWIMTLVFLPGIGFLIYIFCGRGINGQKVFKITAEEKESIRQIRKRVEWDNQKSAQGIDINLLTDARVLNKYFRNMDESPLCKRNSIELYTDGKEKFEALFKDIQQAKESIHVEYYSFFNDRIGNRFLRLLEEKLKEGLSVHLIYDPWGSPGTNKKFFANFIALGGKVSPFITSKNMISKTRLNYHLHRKIVVIDGKIGWTGGFNVGDQYLGENQKFGYWRDTHIRVVGTAVFSLQEIFIMDWNASAEAAHRMTYMDKYFQFALDDELDDLALQVVSDGPNTEEEILKSGFIKMILSAEKSVWIQTPYLIPDESMINALLIAVRSGIDVRIMIPCMPDHPFIYRATQYYANYLHKRGVKIYNYQNGFLHAKTMIIDKEICMVGTTNQDIRSYALNFEVSTFIYDTMFSWKLAQIFEKDMIQSILLTDEIINNQSKWLRFKQNFSRLLSPVL